MGKRRYRTRRKSGGRVVLLLLIILLAAAALLVEYGGGKNGIPTWSDLHHILGLETGAPDSDTIETGESTVTFFDVGQGDAVLISQDGEYCLIDAGTYDAKDQLTSDLLSAGVRKLKYLVMTHPHADHIGGMPTVMKSIPAETLLLPNLEAAGVTSGTLDAIQRQASQQNTSVVYGEPGLELPLGGGTLTVLSTGVLPTAAEISAESDPEVAGDVVNNLSLCVRFEAGGFSFLDTGDAEAEEEEALVNQYGGKLKSTLMKAGHHGSSTSNTWDLLDVVLPKTVVVSCGLNNDYGHPHAIILGRYASENIEVYRTDLQGTVTVQWKDGALQAVAAAQQEPLAPAA